MGRSRAREKLDEGPARGVVMLYKYILTKNDNTNNFNFEIMAFLLNLILYSSPSQFSILFLSGLKILVRHRP